MTRERAVSRNGWYPVRLVGGWMLVVIGVLMFPLPVPAGLILIVIGLALLAHDSRRIRSFIVRMGRRHPDVRDRALHIAASISRPLGNYLHRFSGRRPRRK